MEIIFILIILGILSFKKTGLTSVAIERLPIRTNPKGYYEEKAFTEVYHQLHAKK